MERRFVDKLFSILVVANETDHRNAIREAIRGEGFDDIVETHSTDDAVELLRFGRFDLVVLDMEFAEAGAHALITQMKTDMDLAQVPVLVIWDGESTDSLAQLIELGIDDHQRWPVDPRLLRARLNACLEMKHLREVHDQYLEQVKAEKRRADDLLSVMLPAAAASELKATGKVLPRSYDDVGILFCDIVDFTSYCNLHSAVDVVGELQSVIAAFEMVAKQHQMEKIKTIGDEFMASSGLVSLDFDPLLTAVRSGLGMIDVVAQLKPDWQVRVGVHAGPVVAGIVGQQKYQYDVWGDTVNTAARMASYGSPGVVALTLDAWMRVEDHCRGRKVGTIDIKGIGAVEMVEVYGLR